MRTSKGTDAFMEAISERIIAMSDSDPVFAERAGNPDKSIEGCVAYILDTVRKSGLCGFTDDEVYSMAVHYYVEDGIETGGIPECQVVINRQVQLTEEEREEMRRQAKERVLSEETSRLRTVGKVANKPSRPVEESSLTLF